MVSGYGVVFCGVVRCSCVMWCDMVSECEGT